MNRNATSKFVRHLLTSPGAVVPVDAGFLNEHALQAAFRNKAFFTWIDRAPVFDKTSLMHAIYQSCAMPAWFGFNWDALIDSLSSLPDAPAYVLALSNPDSLKTQAPDDYSAFIRVIQAVRDRLAVRHIPFVMLVPAGTA